MKYRFIINQNAGTGKVKKILPEFLNLIKSNLENYDYFITNDLEEVPQAIGNINDFDVIVSVGGDGTFNGILNCIPDCGKIFGIIPVGTGNDFPMMLNVTKDLAKSINTIKKGDYISVDVGHLQTEKYKKYFINAVGIGFDAKVAKKTNQIKFIDGGLSKYVLALLSSLFSYKTPKLLINLNHEEEINKKCFLLTIGNGRRTGGGFLLTPAAILDDGVFDICIVDEVSIFRVLQVFPSVLKGEHVNIPEVKIFRNDKISVKSEDDLFLHYDGETPDLVKNIEIELLPKKLKVLCNLQKK